MNAYYNEIEPYAADWLANLVRKDHINPGRVDRRSIAELRPDDLNGFKQCHFFAGIGVWSHALRLAGWPDDFPVWTGSCPCQPFSVAGAGGGFDDARHLWPTWFELIRQCRPPVVFGEQVASPDGLKWLDLVSADLENAGYAFGAADLCAAGIGAPHIRQRLYFCAYDPGALADTTITGRGRQPVWAGEASDGPGAVEPGRLRTAGGLAHHHHQGLGLERGAELPQDRDAQPGDDAHGRGPDVTVRLADDDDARLQGRGVGGRVLGRESDLVIAPSAVVPGPTNGFWSNAEWVPCIDGKWRPTEPGTFPLVNGAPSRVGRLRAYGNAIVSEVAATFIRAFIESRLK